MKHSCIVPVLAAAAAAACVESSDPENQIAAKEDQGGWSLADQEAAMEQVEKARSLAYRPGLRAQIPAAEWIELAYHGRLFDANFEEIELDEATLDKMQASMFELLYPTFGPAAKQKYGADLKDLVNTQETGLDRLVLGIAALRGLISVADEKHVFRFEGRLDHLNGGLNVLMVRFGYQIPRRIRDMLIQYRIPEQYVMPPIEFGYVDRCVSAQVPIPPDWPDPRWIHQGRLSFVFVSGMVSDGTGGTGPGVADVYTYRDPAVPGICYALPRTLEGTSNIRLLGIICQSETTGRACFWDNRTREGVPITGEGIRLDIDTIANGDTLRENCTDCHRGDNAYIIHPGSALDVSGRWGRTPVGGPWDATPATRYQPISRKDTWRNPASVTLPPPPSGQRSCTGCHQLPGSTPSRDGSGNYCDLLRSAAEVTMPAVVPGAPSERPAGWPPRLNPAYERHMTALSRCLD